MKIDKISDADYQIVLSVFFSCEEDIISIIKDILKKYQKKLNLKGFYKIIVFNFKYGLFFRLMQIEDSYYKNTFDYRIMFDEKRSFYYQTKDYFIISNLSEVYYFDGYYYALIDDSFDKIFEKVEFGKIILDSDIDFMDKCVVI